ncbi:glycoside hydrolase family 2 TIM barrel-domain containing protein [Opitutales bacterium ASA1]|uniref:glycoside hydrolase family 2 protein n=1 Tax=Congregicoccus parvus TaxID=3081749 RepID=UPI002B2CAC6A|nr:glycoside hydrolase family 2 TIM barrel-domain containing protein [Opitutales bacterium ASA1]
MADGREPRRISVPLVGPWRFLPGEAADAAYSESGDETWESVTLPHCWNGADVAAGRGDRGDPRAGYRRGPGWYRLRFHWSGVGDEGRTSRVFLRFEGASQFADVFVNGSAVGSHAGAFTAFCFEVTRVLREGDNLLAVRVDNRWSPELAPLDGDFVVFGGLYRPVRFITILGPGCIDPTVHGSPGLALTPRGVCRERAEFEVRVQLAGTKSGDEVLLRVRDGADREVACATCPIELGADHVTHPFVLLEPRLWDGLRDPHLYVVRAELWTNGTCVDIVEETFGLRTARFDPERGFLLNERVCPIRGVSRHQDRHGKGWALSDTEHIEDLGMILDMGANAVRLAHYPQAESVYAFCDRHGLLVWSEIPLVNCCRDEPGFVESTRRQLAEMIHQHRNRACVFAWGIWNELGMAEGPSPAELVRALHRLARTIDPTRETIAAGFDRTFELHPELVSLTDQVGWNQYHGWYEGAPSDLGPALDRLRALVPHKGLAVSEYGAGANPNHHLQRHLGRPDPGGDWHPEEWQGIVHEGNWAAIVERSWVWGCFVWAMFDFASAWRTEGGYRGLNDKGLVTADRGLRKDAFFFYRALWSAAPTLYLTSRRHILREEATTPVKVYSNLGDVHLTVCGRKMRAGRRDGVVWTWEEIVLEPGENTIEVVGYGIDGRCFRDSCVWTLGASSRAVALED